MLIPIFGDYREFERSSMAQRVNVVLVDDIDGSDADETVSFALDGVDYEIDLSDKHAGELRDALASTSATPAAPAGAARAAAARPRPRRAHDGASAAEIRAWARENGWDVPERGRVTAEVREAYAAAN